MFKLIAGLIISLTLTLSGCDSSEQTTAKQEPPAPRENAVAAAEQAAQAVAAKVAEMDKQLKPALEESEQKAAEMAKETGDAAQSAAAAAEQKLETAAMATARAVEQSAQQAQVAMAPEQLTLEASYGNISFPHGTHAASFACTTCHGEGTPAAFGLTKETAHPLCKGCHQEQGAGPTACTGCHKK